jgi:tRNA pseudouridine38-40 synthase
MPRYFIELAYHGKNFAGFQRQPNAETVQGSVEKALSTILRAPIETTTSSRTDAGVHALQNFLHFDFDYELPNTLAYNANAILHRDIVIIAMHKVNDKAHSRFDAMARTYEYIIYQNKNPFLKEIAYFYPFPLDIEILQKSALQFKENTNFQSFCKRHVEVSHYECNLLKIEWAEEADHLKFTVKGNRFLRGMVRALVGTSLQMARGKIELNDLQSIIASNDCRRADFSADAKGLKLVAVEYPKEIFI